MVDEANWFLRRGRPPQADGPIPAQSGQRRPRRVRLVRRSARRPDTDAPSHCTLKVRTCAFCASLRLIPELVAAKRLKRRKGTAEAHEDEVGARSVASFSMSSADVAKASALPKRVINLRQAVRDSPVIKAVKACAICFPLERPARRQRPTPSLFARMPLSIWSKQIG